MLKAHMNANRKENLMVLKTIINAKNMYINKHVVKRNYNLSIFHFIACNFIFM